MKRRNVAHRQRYFQHASEEHRGDPAGHKLLTEKADRGGEGRGLKELLIPNATFKLKTGIAMWHI